MGSLKFVTVNHHQAQISDDPLNIVLARMVEVGTTTGVNSDHLKAWAFHACFTGDSLSFIQDTTHDGSIDEDTAVAVVKAARERILAIGDVHPEMVADWRMHVEGEQLTRNTVCEGTLRGNRTVSVSRLLEVVDWLLKALRWAPEAEYDAVIGS